MFIQIQFGYKQSRVFTIDCLTATLMDTIWAACLSDILALLTSGEQKHRAQIAALEAAM